MTTTTDPSRDDTAVLERPLLDVAQIDFAYGQQPILFGISLAVRPGEALALVGTNGAGKSTLLRVVSGLERPASGSVTFDGADITGVPAHRLAADGLVLISGGKSVFTDMSVEENLEIQGLAIRGQSQLYAERRERVLETFPRLGERLHQPAGRGW